MACFHPIPAYQCPQGGVFFSELKRYGSTLRPLEIPCGQCIGCRLERSRQWAMRCMHEASLFDENSFLTLTYDEDHLPVRGQLVYSDFQKFLKRLRKAAKVKLSFFMCGEYGELTARPHFHALIFNYGFPDKVAIRVLDSGCKVFRSALLEKLWPCGMSSIGSVTFESAAYVARYCVKKVTGKGAAAHYRRVDEVGEYDQVPELAHMSLKPAIGKRWLEKFETDVYPHDYVVINGKEVKPPKYYDKLFAESSPWIWQELQYERSVLADSLAADNTVERLQVKEVVAKARINQFGRSENNG